MEKIFQPLTKTVFCDVIANTAVPYRSFVGLCNPFVEITFLPENVFPAEKKLSKTQIQKKTHNPIFNEEFRL